jgi:hypothetical protein
VNERERGLGGVESVCAADDQFDLVVERLCPGSAQFQPTGGEDALAVFADRFAQADERSQSQRERRARSRSSSSLTASTVRPGAKIALTRSFIAQARATFPPAARIAARVLA